MALGWALAAIDAVARETALFAASGLLVGGIDDLAVDLLYLLQNRPPDTVPPLPADGLQSFAILIPAWDEAGVIGAMLETTLERWGAGDYRLYVGTYPNDPATTAVVAAAAMRDPRVRLVIGDQPGPTTKGANLNTLWAALLRDESAEGWSAATVVLHDAEDLVDPDELRVFDAMLDRYDVVQLPVLPLIARGSRWVSAHYADEFAEISARGLAVRQAIGAGLPLAGTGCAIRRGTLVAVAASRGGLPFDPTSLTEDYELGLTLAAQGARGCFARVRGGDGRRIAVRAFFPAALGPAVRQKARWMTGIALLGWDRIGWAGARVAGEYWMRMRDRRAPLGMLVLAVAYIALGAATLSVSLHLAARVPFPATTGWMLPLFLVNTLILTWRMAMRASATAAVYGWREGVRAIPRLVVANFIGLLAARRALTQYVRALSGRRIAWDKTSHVFPVDPRMRTR